MAVCYSCKITLNKSNHSWEHIIPSALGSSLKSRRLICRSCNEKAGGLIDKALVDYCRPWILKYDIQPDRMARTPSKSSSICNDPAGISQDLIKQAVIKICTNFYYWKNVGFNELIIPVCEPQTLGISQSLFNTKPYHILYIHANPADKTIYSFLELFGEIGFRIKLSSTYNGCEIRQSLVIAPNTKTKLTTAMNNEAEWIGNYLDTLLLRKRITLAIPIFRPKFN